MSSTVRMSEIPLCDFCNDEETRASYDFHTIFGPWAYGCKEHWEANRAHSELGTGKGQLIEVVS